MHRFLKAFGQLDRIPEVLRCRAATKDWFPLATAYLGFPTRFPFRIALSSGPFEFREASDIPTFWRIFFNDIYTVRPEDRVIVDAGANIGAFTLFALLRAPSCHVIAIEPAPDSCQRLRSTLAAHGLSHRCTVYEAALADYTGHTTINLKVGGQFRVTGEGDVRVPTVTLDEVCAPLGSIDLLKIDTEGAEYSVFPAAKPELLERIDRIEMEYHPSGKPEDILGKLQEVGFSVVKREANVSGYGMLALARAPVVSQLEVR